MRNIKPLKHLTLKNAVAFTLAETLIVIGIIGVVSALTLPNLNSSTGDKEKVAKVQKIYQNLNDALGRAEAVYGPFNTWFINDTQNADKAKRAGERITEFMKASKTCGLGTGKGCFTGGNSKLLHGNDNADAFDSNANSYKIITADGSSISIDPNFIIVDIDGPTKGKYTWGQDIFWFNFDDTNGVIPEHYDITFTQLLDYLATNKGNSAAAWIIRYENMDYLQLTNKNGTCKNGNVMTEANPRCK
ncbi:prepilin-type N-terminal cleavage/methylation domain-containing protein [bacterium]|nr:prepilin-type N-terminal cleavage/methylation domain-containing protein [bacterium]